MAAVSTRRIRPSDMTASMATVHDDADEEYADLPVVKFINQSFKKRSCKRFVKKEEGTSSSSSSDGGLCCCGYMEHMHTDESKRNGRDNEAKPWNYKADTVASPTDAFGEVQFTLSGQRICKFIRVEQETKVDDLVDLMLDYWQMEPPNLLISVTGGAQNFTMIPRLREVFREGLVKAAESTRAWIVTGGTNAGVMKHVGEAIRDHAIRRGSKKQLVVLGIATWGCIENKDELISYAPKANMDFVGRWPVYYRGNKDGGEKKRESPLDPNHTHFILVDNGTQHQFGVEISLRANLERKISMMKTLEAAISIPIVCLVLEGGPNTLETVKKAIDSGTPAIIVAGSGRAADVLAYAYSRCKEMEVEAADAARNGIPKEHTTTDMWTEVADMIRKEFSKNNERDIKQLVDLVRSCMEKMDHITVFRLDGESSAKDIDITILRALLKVNRGKNTNQLRLALAWDRVDIAKDEIFTYGVTFEDSELEKMMFSAIVNNRPDFVKLFLEKGLDLMHFLTSQRLQALYNHSVTKENCRHLVKMAKRGAEISLKNVGDLMKQLIGGLFEPTYSTRTFTNKGKRKDRNATAIGLLPIDPLSSSAPDFDNPCRELFIWSTLNHMKSMAMVFWYQGYEDTALSAIGHLLLKGLLEREEQDSELATKLREQVAFFEDLSVGLLSECNSSDPRKTVLLLVRELPGFGRTTTIKMAVQANNRNFVAHQASQTLLTDIWTGQLSDDNHYIVLLISIFLPPIAPVILKFREKERTPALDSSAQTTARQANKRKGFAGSISTGVENITNEVEKTTRPCVTFVKRLHSFFDAPIIKFSYNCLSYLAFLLLYGVILLTDFYPTIRIKEMILIAWVGTLLIEEIRQVIMDDAGDIRLKFYNYITDIWNILDVIIIAMFFCGIILRFIPVSMCDRCFYASRIILALNLMTFFFRILNMFSIHRELGPKLVMIGQMMIDLYYFMIILLVFIAAYGISAHIILYPNQPLNIALARDVLSDAWWNLFGNIPLDQVSGTLCANVSSSPTAEECASLDYADYEAADCVSQKDAECPAIDWLVPILLAIYSLITSVMMLNLLIAMFSNTFSNIQGQTNVVWKMQRYHLVREYDSRPLFPPPLIVLQHIFILLRYIINRFKCCCSRWRREPRETSKFGFRMTFKANEEKELLNWENVIAEEYLKRMEEDQRESADSKAKETNERVDIIRRKVEEIAEMNFLASGRLPPVLEKRFSQLEKQMQKTLKALDWIMANMSSQSSSSSTARMPLTLPDTD